MLLHPDVVQKAHEEIDRVVGRDRLPTFQDRDNLPYVDCVLKEVLRWNPAAPLSESFRNFVSSIAQIVAVLQSVAA